MNRFILLLFFLLRKKFDDSLFKVFGADLGKSMPVIDSNPVSSVGWSMDRVSWEEESHRGPPFRKGKGKRVPEREGDPEGLTRLGDDAQQQVGFSGSETSEGQLVSLITTGPSVINGQQM